jgi:hypothetical protein
MMRCGLKLNTSYRFRTASGYKMAGDWKEWEAFLDKTKVPVTYSRKKVLTTFTACASIYGQVPDPT